MAAPRGQWPSTAPPHPPPPALATPLSVHVPPPPPSPAPFLTFPAAPQPFARTTRLRPNAFVAPTPAEHEKGFGYMR